MSGLETRRRCGELMLNVREWGPADGALLILLHGFPDFSLAWRHQADTLAAAGFQVVAPDQRGYGGSDKPKGAAAYDIDRLTGDVLALAASYGAERFTVVGHDWGAAVTWWLATTHPEALDRAVMINAPHPAVWKDAMANDPVQKKKSSYVKLLGLPFIPERLLSARHNKALVDSLRTSRDTLTDDLLDDYRRAWNEPGALTGMINWYRAMLKRDFPMPQPRSIPVPTMVIWGTDDAYAIPSMASRSAALCANARLEFIEGAGHWSMWDQPHRVNELLLAFLHA